MSERPWTVAPENWDACNSELFPRWLKERGGVVVYENHMMDSSYMGDKTFLPARYIATDGQSVEAPDEWRPEDGLPSLRQQKVDHIKLEDFEGVDDALRCFVKDTPEGSRP